MTDGEKRRFLRHLLVYPLQFQVSEEKGFEKTETVNVSEGGLMFLSAKNVKEGETIKINIPLYDKVFHINAKVCHCAKDESNSSMFRVGVEFMTYQDAFKVKLIEQIYLIEEYRVLRSLQLGRDISLQEASKEWIKRYSERFKKLYW